MNQFNTLVQLVNVYDIFGKCYVNPTLRARMTKERKLEASDLLEIENMGLTSDKYTPFLHHQEDKKHLKVVPPCVYAKPILDYFHNATVMTQLHVDPAAPVWDLCVDSDKFPYTGSQNATEWIYPLLKGKYRILKYSGDADGAVPTYGTQQWINELGWTVTEAWRPYYITNMYGQQVAGYVEVRDGLTFATIHGAGHMAPQFKRQPTYHAIFNFINGVPL